MVRYVHAFQRISVSRETRNERTNEKTFGVRTSESRKIRNKSAKTRMISAEAKQRTKVNVVARRKKRKDEDREGEGCSPFSLRASINRST